MNRHIESFILLAHFYFPYKALMAFWHTHSSCNRIQFYPKRMKQSAFYKLFVGSRLIIDFCTTTYYIRFDKMNWSRNINENSNFIDKEYRLPLMASYVDCSTWCTLSYSLCYSLNGDLAWRTPPLNISVWIGLMICWNIVRKLLVKETLSSKKVKLIDDHLQV